MKSVPTSLFPFPFLKQLADEYTHLPYKEQECGRICTTRILYNVFDLGVVDVHTVEDIFKPGQVYEVKWWWKTWGAECTCKHFEFYGFTCGHIFLVCHHQGMKYLTDDYIVYRWKRGLKDKIVNVNKYNFD